MARQLASILVGTTLLSFVSISVADEIKYRYEGDVLPETPGAGWWSGAPCIEECTPSIEDDALVMRWEGGAWWATFMTLLFPPAPLATLWVEWRCPPAEPFPGNGVGTGTVLLPHKPICFNQSETTGLAE